jgi:hypothetical protein
MKSAARGSRLLCGSASSSNLIGLHVIAGLPATEQATAQLAGPFGSRATGVGDPAAQGTAALASIVCREAYVLAYIDAF